jgi:hypothetical protein
VPYAGLRAGDAVVTGKVDVPALIDNILQLLPDTQTIAVVMGTSRNDRHSCRLTAFQATPLVVSSTRAKIGGVSGLRGAGS